MADQTEISNWAASTSYAANDIVTIAGALWRRISAGTSGSSWDLDEKLEWEKLSPDETTDALLTVWIDGTDGADSNSGSSTSPVATIAGAFARVPDRVLHPVLLRICDAADPYDIAPLKKDVIAAPVGISGADLVTEVLGATAAQSGTNASKIVTSGGMTKNEYQGCWVQITGGAGVGALMQIAWNDEDTIYPVAPFNVWGDGAPNTTSTFKIITPNVILQGAPTGSLLAQDTGGGVAAGFPGGVDMPTLHLALVSLQPVSGFTLFGVRNARVALWACDLAGGRWDASDTSQVLAGADTAVTGGSNGPYELGLSPSRGTWYGAGLLGLSGFLADAPRLTGFMCFRTAQAFQGDVHWVGGSIVSDDGAALTVKGGRMVIEGNNNTKARLFVDDAQALSRIGIEAYGGARVQTRFTAVEFTSEGVLAGIGILAWSNALAQNTGPGEIALGDNIEVNGGPTYLAAAMNGGRITAKEPIQHDTSPVIEDLAILPVQVTDTASTTMNNSAFAEGASIIDGQRFSSIRRSS